MAGGARSSPTHPDVLKARIRDERVYSLRVQGWDFSRIATEVGFADRGAAYKSFNRAHSRMVEHSNRNVEKERDLDVARIDGLLASLYQTAIGETHAEPREVNEAVKRVRELVALRAQLLGTNAATKVETKASLVDADGKAMAMPVIFVPGIADVAAWASAAAQVAEDAKAAK